MKAEGYKFPVFKESDAMFTADIAPEWEDGDRCHRCRVMFSMLLRKVNYIFFLFNFLCNSFVKFNIKNIIKCILCLAPLSRMWSSILSAVFFPHVYFT